VERHRYALCIAYEGTTFRGFQRQPGLPTVQEALERALSHMGLHVRLDVAARTDGGVHALAQVVSFSAQADIAPDALRAAVNRSTPSGLLCLEAWRVSPSFHARASALSRRYVYLVGLPPPPTLARYCWALPDERAFPGVRAEHLDAAAMEQALAFTLGSRDFSGFARPGAQRNPVRTLVSAGVAKASFGPLYAFVLEGKGFLRAMVRNLVGTWVAVGLGVVPPTRVKEILATRERYRGVRAPGWGLTLAAVTYPEGTFPSSRATWPYLARRSETASRR
jgi:tRNA pseudouridine38-40 synthase